MNRRKILLFKKRQGTPLNLNLIEFDAALTTPSAGALTNVYGADWTVVRASEAWYKPTASSIAKIAANVPRIESGKVLIELASSNLLGYSAVFNGTGWALTSASASLHGSIPAPDGTLTATHIVGGTDIGHINSDPKVGVSGGTKSIWARTISGTGTMQFGIFQTNLVNVTETWQEFKVENHSESFFDRFYAADFRLTATLEEVLIWGAVESPDPAQSSYIESVGGVTGTRAADVITNTVPVGANRLIEWLSGIEQPASAVIPGETLIMKNGTTKLTVDNQGPTQLMAFLAETTTPSVGALTNEIGSAWTVVRDNNSSVRSDTDTLTLLSPHEPKIEGGKVLVEPAFVQRGLGTDQLESGTFWSARTTITANNINSIDGTLNAEKLECNETNAFGSYTLWNRTMPNQDTQPTTAMFFIKPGNNTNVLMTATYSGQVFDVWFNLTGAGVKGSTDARTGTAITYIDHGIEYWSDGWYRCWLTVQDSQASLSLGLRAGVCDADLSTNSTLGDYIYGCHWNVVEGATLRNYMLNLSGTDKYAEADVITNTVPVGANRLIEWIDGVEQDPRGVSPGATLIMKNGITKLIIDDQDPSLPAFPNDVVFGFRGSELGSITGGTIPVQIPSDGSADFTYTGTPTLSAGSVIVDAGDSVTLGANSTLINSPEGTLYINGLLTADDGVVKRIGLSDGSDANGVWVQTSGTLGALLGRVRVGGVDSLLTSTSLTITTKWKAAITWKLNEFKFAVNGVVITTDTSGATFGAGVLDRLDFARDGITNLWLGGLDEAHIYPTVKTDSELIALTT